MTRKKASKKMSKKRTARRNSGSSLSLLKKLTADQARALGDSFEGIADALRQWRREHSDRLTNDQIKQLRYLQLTLLHNADSLTTVAIGFTLDEAAVSLNQLNAATAKAEQAIETIENTKEVIEIAAAAISLAASVFAKDVGGAAKAAASLFSLATASTDES